MAIKAKISSHWLLSPPLVFMWFCLFLCLNIYNTPPENKNNDNTKLMIFKIMVVLAVFQCLLYATVLVTCFLSTLPLTVSVTLREGFPSFTYEETVDQGGGVTCPRTYLVSQTNLDLNWCSYSSKGFWHLWIRSYFNITRNRMEWRILLLAMKLWGFSLCSWNLLLRRSRKKLRGRLHICTWRCWK